MANSKEYRALVGMNYISKETGNEKRAEPGDKITDMAENAVKHETKAGNLEEWVARQTENVVTDEEARGNVEITGVVSRHRDGEIQLKEAGE